MNAAHFAFRSVNSRASSGQGRPICILNAGSAWTKYSVSLKAWISSGVMLQTSPNGKHDEGLTAKQHPQTFNSM